MTPLPRPVRFETLALDPDSGARRGLLHTPNGSLETPAFMPVGTQATVKGLTPDLVRETGGRMVLANTYHLALRPGEEVAGRSAACIVHGLGRPHPDRFRRLPGVQPRREIEDHGGRASSFRSHLDGRLLDLTPERAVAIQEALGADVAMCLDHCPALPPSKETVAAAVPDDPLGEALQGGPMPPRSGPLRDRPGREP